MSREYDFWVYIVTNRRSVLLYVRVTNNLAQPPLGHRQDFGANFPAAYRCTQPVFCEHYARIDEAIAREKQLKRWSRAKKIALINTLNPKWLDLGVDVLAED